MRSLARPTIGRTAAGAGFRASLGGQVRDQTVPYAALTALIHDLEDGRGSELIVGDEYLAFDAEVEVVSVPFGPLEVTGTIDEWRSVLDRELGDMKPADELAVSYGDAWEGVRSEFHVLESE